MRERRRLMRVGGLALVGALVVGASGAATDAAPTVWAQEDGAGQLTGVVTAPDGVPLAGAVITVSSAALESGDTSMTTDDGGAFMLGPIPTGLYDVAVELEGYRRGLLAGLSVSDGKTTDASLILEPRSGGEDGY